MRGLDCIVLVRWDLEAFLGLERFKNTRVKWLTEDLKPWFPSRTPYYRTQAPSSINSLFLAPRSNGQASTHRLDDHGPTPERDGPERPTDWTVNHERRWQRGPFSYKDRFKPECVRGRFGRASADAKKKSQEDLSGGALGPRPTKHHQTQNMPTCATNNQELTTSHQ